MQSTSVWSARTERSTYGTGAWARREQRTRLATKHSWRSYECEYTNNQEDEETRDYTMSDKSIPMRDTPVSKAEKAQLRASIEGAKAKQRARPGNMKNTPRFDETASWSNTPKVPSSEILSDQTKESLNAAARAVKQQQKQVQPEEETADVTEGDGVYIPTLDDNERFLMMVGEFRELNPEEKTELADIKTRKAVESRIDDIDLGEYFMAGYVRQVIPIIPNKLEVTFQTISDLVEGYIDIELSAKPLTNRVYIRKANEYGLAAHIKGVTLNGQYQEWMPLLDGDGTVNPKAMDWRIKQIKKLNSQMFQLLAKNLGWFLDRINDQLTIGVLGNG